MALCEGQGEKPRISLRGRFTQLAQREARRSDGLRVLPALTFVGTLNADTDPDRLYSSDRRGGETTWREMAIDQRTIRWYRLIRSRRRRWSRARSLKPPIGSLNNDGTRRSGVHLGYHRTAA